MLLTEIDVIDAVLARHAATLGDDLTAYRNHVYRVANFCHLLCAPDAEQQQKLAIAAVFHDLGIWTNRTFDYIGPSVLAAETYLAASGRDAWAPEIAAMIRDHHKISAHRGPSHSLVETFRRADWIDVSGGLRSFGLGREARAPVFRAWPDAGFHRRLIALSLARLRSHPWSPLPMLRL